MTDDSRPDGHRLKVIHVVGARPNFMKVAPIMREMAKYPDAFEQILVHTGQHYDENMSKVFFEDLELPRPDVYLGVGSGSHAQQTARVMMAFGPVLQEYKPDWVIVVGDVNSTLACALTAAKLNIQVAHVESGLRSFDRAMPEEINRILTDHIADLLFTTEPSGNENLCFEGTTEEKIHFVGNVMIDTLVYLLPKAKKRAILTELGLTLPQSSKTAAPFALVTLHRPANVDDPETLAEIFGALEEIGHDVSIVFPVHPRTQEQIAKSGLYSPNSNIRLIDPLGYLDFLALMRNAALVITDSGGIQEETTFLGVPCLTVRPNTERPVTLTEGTNRLIASSHFALVEAVRDILNSSHSSPSESGHPELWDGRAAERIVKTFQRVER